MAKPKTQTVETCGPPRTINDDCRKPHQKHELESYAAIVRDYRKTRGSVPDEVLEFYREQKSIRDALKLAAYAKKRNGKLHRHQYKLDKSVYPEIHDRLKRRDLAKCTTFHELFQTVKGEILSIHGVGPLMVYDTAHRLGAFLNLKPEFVYLHAGAKEGAAALGIKKKPWISPSELPKEFRKLTPGQIEDCLCVYKDKLKAIQNR